MTAPNSNFSSDQETKKFVTPFAFGVHDSLLGKRLASPKRRLASFTVDMICVALLTKLSGFWFSALVLLVAVWSLRSLKEQDGQRLAKLVLRVAAVLSAIMLLGQSAIYFVTSDKRVGDVVDTAEQVEAKPQSKALEYRNSRVDDEYKLTVSALKGQGGAVVCSVQSKCDAAFFTALVADIVKKKYNYDDAAILYSGVRTFLLENDRLDDSMADTTLSHQLYQIKGGNQPLAVGVQSRAHSLIAWVVGILGDLGLSFGWAALYFCVLTSSWNGQTVGKRLLGIKVVRIDGKGIDLWESFGRYGGYSAGVATGLLGFIQIYWDANRQAIQDKISETLVIRL